MAVLERSELQASPLADLHAIADQMGLDGFRRLRKAELIAAILGEEAPATDDSGESPAVSDDSEKGEAGRSETGRSRRRATRSSTGRTRRSRASAKEDTGVEDTGAEEVGAAGHAVKLGEADDVAEHLVGLGVGDLEDRLAGEEGGDEVGTVGLLVG